VTTAAVVAATAAAATAQGSRRVVDWRDNGCASHRLRCEGGSATRPTDRRSAFGVVDEVFNL